MRFLGSYSADMYDLRKPKERRRLVRFGRWLVAGSEDNRSMAPAFMPLVPNRWSYAPGAAPKTKHSTAGRRVLVISDAANPESNLARMVRRLVDCFAEPIDVVKLHQLDIRGSCTGCIQCGLDNQCVYGDSDDFIGFYRERVLAADAIVLAGDVQDRFLSARWKTFFDRSFFNTHTPSLKGKQLAAVISGPLGQLADLREILNAYAQWQQAGLVDVVTDEAGDSATVDRRLENLAARLIEACRARYTPPPTFLAVAGMKVFRDDVWGRLRLVFQADHKYYRRHGIYDFPQKDLPTRLLNALMMPLTKLPPVRRQLRRRIRQEMLRPLLPIVERARPDREHDDEPPSGAAR
jgi:multimeric flavodoxin WrbA